jgi:hypothetical protein
LSLDCYQRRQHYEANTLLNYQCLLYVTALLLPSKKLLKIFSNPKRAYQFIAIILGSYSRKDKSEEKEEERKK